MMGCIWLLGCYVTRFRLFGLIFFIEESEVIWIFCLISSSLLLVVNLKKLVRKCLLLVGWGRLMIAYAMMAMISRKNSDSGMTIPSTDVIWVFMLPWMSWAVFMAILVSNSCGGRSNSSLAGCVTPIRMHLRKHIFPLSNLWTIFHTVGLLDEKHIPMILRGFGNFWSSPSIINIYASILIWLWTYWPVRHIIICLRSLIVLLLILILVGCSISRPESSKPRTVHLLLKQVARVSIMDIILKSLNQSLLIVSLLIFRSLNQVVDVVRLVH